MSSGTTQENPPFYLTPQQQSLLYAALNSNKQAGNQPAPSSNPVSLSPESYQTSPVMDSGLNGGVDNSFLPNFDYGDFGGDSSFDFSFADDSHASLIGDLPDSTTIIKSEPSDNDGPSDKRSHPDDEEDEADNGNDPKRREGTEKVPKKPGRKPLTSEPSSKRKAQNRAAQRAFRERKEKHLKDLETKVDELQKASDAANNENTLLRSQVEKMTSELNEYKTRFSIMRNRSASGGTPRVGFGSPALGHLSDVNFQFEFPKFGVLPGPNTNTNGNAAKPAPQKSISSGSPLAALGRKPLSPPLSNPRSKENSISPVMSNGNFNLSKEDMANFSTFFDPSFSRPSMSTSSRPSVDSGPHSLHNGTSTSSPSASSLSNGGGPSSSCGTSPEPFTQSPMGFKPVDTMTTIGEEQSAMTTGQNNNVFGNFNPNSFDWLAQQNGGNFDPQLFGDYREPQDNVLATNTFDDTFFNDAFDSDFFLPYNVAPSPNLTKKTNLIDQIDAAKSADDLTQVSSDQQQKLNCTQVFASLQNCPKVQAGEFDLDSLCSELQKKAKCSGEGPTVSEGDFQSVVNKWMGKDTADCVTASLKGQTATAKP